MNLQGVLNSSLAVTTNKLHAPSIGELSQLCIHASILSISCLYPSHSSLTSISVVYAVQGENRNFLPLSVFDERAVRFATSWLVQLL